MMFKPEAIMFARPPVWLFPPTLAHFDYVLAYGFVWNLIASLVIALASTLLVVLIGTPAAYAFARFAIRRRDDLLLFVLATRMAPPIAFSSQPRPARRRWGTTGTELRLGQTAGLVGWRSPSCHRLNSCPAR